MPSRCRDGGGESVGEVAVGSDIRGGGEDAVHVITQGDAVPVHRGGAVEPVLDGDGEFIANVGADQWTGERVPVGPRSRERAAQVNGCRLRCEGGGHRASSMWARLLGGGDGLVELGCGIVRPSARGQHHTDAAAIVAETNFRRFNRKSFHAGLGIQVLSSIGPNDMLAAQPSIPTPGIGIWTPRLWSRPLLRNDFSATTVRQHPPTHAAVHGASRRRRHRSVRASSPRGC